MSFLFIQILDDNHWLIEWLAYHYHVLPLRHLIVAVDPTSTTNPERILARWTYMMKIQVWHDKDFMHKTKHPKHVRKTHSHSTANNTETNDKLMQHRTRQNTFFAQCMQTLKEQKQTTAEWVQLVDTDEFTAVNYASGRLYNLTKHHPIATPGSVLRLLHHYQDALQAQHGQQHDQVIPPQDSIYMPRFMFGAKESPPKHVERNIPHSSKSHPRTKLKGRSFLTQRYLYRNPKRMFNGKNMVRLSAISQQSSQSLSNVHRVSSVCPTYESVARTDQIKTSLLRVHHYLGSREQYFSRANDPRAGDNTTRYQRFATILQSDDPGSPTAQQQQPQLLDLQHGVYYKRDIFRYQQLNDQGTYSDSGTRGWITGFIQDVGLPMAEYLLEGVGQVER